MKTCRVCGEEKSLKDFYKDSYAKDGYRSDCKVCKTKSLYAWRDKNRDFHNGSRRRYTKENKDKISAWNKNNFVKNRSTRSALNQARREAVKKAKTFVIVDKDINRVYSGNCIRCGSSENITADHIIPLSRGGSHGIGNLMSLCKSCNSSKHNKLYSEWRYKK